MTIRQSGAWMLLSAVILVTGACATDGGGYSSPDSGGSGAAASGSVEDTLQACLARIPSDASAGQRMLAERSCERDQTNRK